MEWRDLYRSEAYTPRGIVESIEFERDDPEWITRIDAEKLDAQLEFLAARLDEAHKDLTKIPLYGIPFAVKDNIDVAGRPTTAGCPAFSYIAGL